jgi:hypothetical protein
MRITVFLCSTLLLVAGCHWGDPMGEGRTISLHFPAAVGQARVRIFASDPDVQEALRVIDGVIVSHGYVRDEKPWGTNCLVTYGPFNSVTLQDDKLTVSLFEYRVRHASLHLKMTCSALKRKLRSSYGESRISVER